MNIALYVYAIESDFLGFVTMSLYYKDILQEKLLFYSLGHSYGITLQREIII